MIQGGGGPTTKKIVPSGKTQDVLFFLFFFKTRSNSTFFAEFGQKVVLKKRTSKIMIFVFSDLFCSFLLFLPDLVNKMSSNGEQIEQKRSCRRENRKMFFVVLL